jgi:hypothetical protein
VGGGNRAGSSAARVFDLAPAALPRTLDCHQVEHDAVMYDPSMAASVVIRPLKIRSQSPRQRAARPLPLRIVQPFFGN